MAFGDDDADTLVPPPGRRSRFVHDTMADPPSHMDVTADEDDDLADTRLRDGSDEGVVEAPSAETNRDEDTPHRPAQDTELWIPEVNELEEEDEEGLSSLKTPHLLTMRRPARKDPSGDTEAVTLRRSRSDSDAITLPMPRIQDGGAMWRELAAAKVTDPLTSAIGDRAVPDPNATMEVAPAADPMVVSSPGWRWLSVGILTLVLATAGLAALLSSLS